MQNDRENNIIQVCEFDSSSLLVLVGKNSTCTVAKATDFIIALIDIAPYFKEGFKHSCSH